MSSRILSFSFVVTVLAAACLFATELLAAPGVQELQFSERGDPEIMASRSCTFPNPNASEPEPALWRRYTPRPWCLAGAPLGGSEAIPDRRRLTTRTPPSHGRSVV